MRVTDQIHKASQDTKSPQFCGPTTGDAAVRIRDYCYEGAVRDAPIGLVTGHIASENAFPSQSYSQSGGLRPLSSTKVSQLKQMMDNFIPSERRMSFS